MHLSINGSYRKKTAYLSKLHSILINILCITTGGPHAGFIITVIDFPGGYIFAHLNDSSEKPVL